MGLQYGLLPNVRNLAMYSFIGLDDKNCMPGTFLFAWDALQELIKEDPTGYQQIHFTTYPGLAHAFPPGEPGKCLEFLSEQKRDTFPKKLVWQYALRPFPVRKDFDRTTRLVQHWFYWIHHANPQDKMEIRAERDGNTITIDAFERNGLHVMLNPEMIDVAEDVVVLLDGVEIYRGKPKPDFRTIVERLDKHQFFDRSIDLGEKR
jgi:hypothetical protein